MTVEKSTMARSKPKMTKRHALIVNLLKIYSIHGYRHSLLEIQKLMYFMQAAGEQLRLNYTQNTG
ncbi:hypothetical protein DSCOOX_39350 [Desulfosarcina ovata subsp. ovata]|uniref:Uncharacterized protein n=1 Tax=Desulfosarcina ovata subsp. ovata TaxID=2752305 RepID=A0A5K8ADR5_9BACT|nr:hypothetical protein DSCOOX_39350 [Desulfosarcina ovata subsp. ovata]